MDASDFLLQRTESIQLKIQPSERLIAYFLFTKFSGWVILFLALCLASFFYAQPQADDNIVSDVIATYASILFLTTITLVFLIYIWLRMVIHKYRYIITNQRCILYSGILNLKQSVIPFSRIVDINVRQNILQRYWNIADVSIHTQNSQDHIIIEGITLNQANTILKVFSEQLKP